MQTENSKATKEVESTVSEKTRQETEAQEPEKVVMGRSNGMDRTHVGGTGKRCQRRKMV
jgi:hypothetical protein